MCSYLISHSMKISFFYTPKPRQFKYSPRFYDPEREKFEELRNKYNLDTNYEKLSDATADELAYFKSKLKTYDKKKNSSDFAWSFIFKKKEMPTFNYKPRFAENMTEEEKNKLTADNKVGYQKKISFRRPIAYDYEDESPMAEPIPFSKVIIYAIVIIIMLLWIFL